MTHLVFSPKAQGDIDGIYIYTADNWSVARAERTIGEVRDACHGLAAGTRRGREVDHVRRGYWRIAVGSHFDFYRRTSSEIEIVRVLHQRMDFDVHLSWK